MMELQAEMADGSLNAPEPPAHLDAAGTTAWVRLVAGEDYLPIPGRFGGGSEHGGIGNGSKEGEDGSS